MIAMRQCQSRRLARRGDRQRPQQVPVLENRRPAEQVVVATLDQRIGSDIEAGGRDHAEIDHLRRRIALGDHHEAAAAKAAHPGLEHSQGERGGDRRIDGVAACGQDLGADLGRLEVLRRYQPAAGSNHGLANRPSLLRGAHGLIRA